MSMGMSFLVLILFILNKVIANDIGNCTEKGKVKCCLHFFLQEEKCVECPLGTYGINCTSSCPSNHFGSKCLQTCNCSKDQICDDKYGCRTPEFYKELYDDCTSGISNTTTKCCTNQRIHGDNCQDCWNGTYGVDCRYKCPQNRYGRFCLNRCNCAANESCHYAYGCNIQTRCSRNRFGDGCRGVCSCSKDQICDYKNGCRLRPPEYFKELYDDCSNGMSNKTTKCCTNQRVLGEDCQDCWNGTYGSDCKHKCPPNRYGRFCLNRCNCAANESCHYATGCNITTGNMRERDLGAEEEEDFGTEDDGSLWIKIPGISLGVIVIILIGIFIFIRIKMRTGRKWDNFVQGNPLSSNLHAGASVTTLLSTTSSRKEDKPKVKVSDYPTLKASQDVDKCFDSYHTIRRDDFHQNRRSIPIFFRRSTDRNKLKSSMLPVSGLRSNFQGGNTGDVYLIKKPEKHSKEDFRGNGNDTGQHVLHKVESGGQFTCEQNRTSNAQDTDSKSNQNAVRYSLVKCV